MPLKLEIIRATEFVRIGAEGHFDLPASKEALLTVAAACRKRGIQLAILDLRALRPGPKPVFTPADLVELLNTFPAVGFTRRLRLAILYASDPHKRARLFAFLSTMHGWNVRAFGDFEEAMTWLSSGEQAPERASQVKGEAGTRIPVRGPGPQRTISDAGRPVVSDGCRRPGTVARRAKAARV